MIVYKDRWYCKQYSSCSDGDHCYRALTEQVIKDAEAEKMPIDCYVGKPPCHKGGVDIFKAHENNGQTA